MTNEVTTVCNGCGKKRSGEDKMPVYYKQVHQNNAFVMKKVHYCTECTPPDNVSDKHPMNRYDRI